MRARHFATHLLIINRASEIIILADSVADVELKAFQLQGR